MVRKLALCSMGLSPWMMLIRADTLRFPHSILTALGIHLPMLFPGLTGRAVPVGSIKLVKGVIKLKGRVSGLLDPRFSSALLTITSSPAVFELGWMTGSISSICVGPAWQLPVLHVGWSILEHTVS